MEDSGETRANSSENFSKERRCRRGGKVADKKRVLVGPGVWRHPLRASLFRSEFSDWRPTEGDRSSFRQSCPS